MIRPSKNLAAPLVLASVLTLAPIATLRAAQALEIVTGCLELSPAGRYVLRSSEEQITLQDAGGMDKHVGRTVRVTGQWQDNADGRRLKVAKIEYVAEGCGG
jgi:hypothetical protein